MVNPVPNLFETPEEQQRQRLDFLRATRGDAPTGSQLSKFAIPQQMALSFGSSFMDGFAGDLKTLNYIFDDDLTEGAEHSLRNVSNWLNSMQPKSVQEARQKQFVTDDWALGDAWGDLYAHTDLAASGMGSIAAMVLGRGVLKILAKGGLKLMVKQSIKKKVDDMMAQGSGEMTRESAEEAVRKSMDDIAAKYDDALGMGAYGTAEMAMVSGSVGHAIEEEIMRAPAEVLNQSNRFRELYYQLVDTGEYTHDQAHNLARTALSREAGKQGAKEIAIPTAILGPLAGRYVNKAIQGRLSKSTLGNFSKLAASESLTETLQGAGEQLTQNRVYKELVDQTRNLWEGVPDAAIREGMGGAFGSAPLSVYGGYQSALYQRALEAAETGKDLNFEDLPEDERLFMYEQAERINSSATEKAMMIEDGVEKWKALNDILAGKAVEEEVEFDPDSFVGPRPDLVGPQQVNVTALQREIRSNIPREELGPFDTAMDASMQRGQLDAMRGASGLEIIAQPDGTFMLGGPVTAAIARKRREIRGEPEPDIDTALADLDLDEEAYLDLMRESTVEGEDLDMDLPSWVAQQMIPEEEKGPFPSRAMAEIQWINLGRNDRLEIFERPDGQWMLGGRTQAQVAERVRMERARKATSVEEVIAELEQIDMEGPAATDMVRETDFEGITPDDAAAQVDPGQMEVTELEAQPVGTAEAAMGVEAEQITADEEIDMARGSIYQKDQEPVTPEEGFLEPSPVTRTKPKRIRAGQYEYNGYEIDKMEESGLWQIKPYGETNFTDSFDRLADAKEQIDAYNERDYGVVPRETVPEVTKQNVLETQFYHGTTKEFDQFQEGTTFISADPQIASEFAGTTTGANVRPVKVTTNNLFDWNDDADVQRLKDNIGRFMNEEANVDYAVEQLRGTNIQGTDAETVVQDNGYDGYIIPEENAVAVFDPANIDGLTEDAPVTPSVEEQAAAAEQLRGGTVSLNKKTKHLTRNGKKMSKQAILNDIPDGYLPPKRGRDPDKYTSEQVQKLYNAYWRAVKGNVQKRAEKPVAPPVEPAPEPEVPRQAAKIVGNTFWGLPKGMQDVALDPRVEEIEDSRKDGEGYWVYLKNGYWNPIDETSSVREPTIKAVQEKMKHVQSVEVPAEQVITKDEVKNALAGLPGSMRMLTEVVDTIYDLPKQAIKVITTREYAPEDVRGLFYEGKIYIVANNMVDMDEAVEVWLHEAVGHLGLRRLLGKDLEPVLEEVARLYGPEIQEIADQYQLDLDFKADRLEAAEELIANMATNVSYDNDPLPDNVMTKIRDLFRALLDFMGWGQGMTKADVRNIIIAAHRSVMDGGNFSNPATDKDVRFSVRPATAEKGKPTHNDTTMQAIRDGQPIDAVFRAVWGVAELTQIPKAVRATSRAALDAGVNFYTDKMPWLRPYVQYAARGLIDEYGLPEGVKKGKITKQAEAAVIVSDFYDILKQLQDLRAASTDKDQMKKITEILTKEAPMEGALEAITEPIRDKIIELGQRAVDLGLISQEVYDANKGAYLHRVYEQYERNKSPFSRWADNFAGRKRKIMGQETMGRGKSEPVKVTRLLNDTGLKVEDLIKDGKGVEIWKENRMSENGQQVITAKFHLTKPKVDDETRLEKFTVRRKTKGTVLLWRDWTKQERQDMGEITDARYVLGKTFALLAHDLSTGQFFKMISENPEWTQDVSAIGDTIHEDDVRDAAEALRLGVAIDVDWVKVPDTKIPKSQARVYGALAGKLVRAEIFQDMNQQQALMKKGVWKTILTQFKLNKTARNPVVHFNNVMSNISLMDLADVRFSDLYRGIMSVARKDDMYQEARIHGALGTSFAEVELRQGVLNELLDEIHAEMGVKPVGLTAAIEQFDGMPFIKQVKFMTKMLDVLWSGSQKQFLGKKWIGIAGIDEKMLNFYQAEDEIFRMATYLRRRAQGMDPTEAGIQARDQFLNYDISAPWINALRASALPFLSYTYRAVPVVAKSIAQRPWKMVKYFTIAYAMNAIAYGLTEGDEERERRSLREEVSGKLWIGADRMIRLGTSEEGNPYFWDIRRIVPVGDIFDRSQYHAALPIVPASLFPSGPMTMPFEFLLNKTAFFGEEITDRLADDTLTQFEKTLDWAWKSYGPSAPWMPYSYYWDKINIAWEGGRDRLGREYNLASALASSFGVKIVEHDVEYGFALKAIQLEQKVKRIRFHLSQLAKDYYQGTISQERYEELSSRYLRSIERLEEEVETLR